MRTIVAALAALLLVATVPGCAMAQDGDGDGDGGNGADDSGSDDTGTDDTGRGGGLDSGSRDEGETNQPEGQVAYIDPEGQVLAGIGEATPAVVGAFAALGPTGQGAVAISPTASALVYVRSDGALVQIETDGADPVVLATDVALDAVGVEPVVGWNGTGDRIAYIAVGTEAEVSDASTRGRSRDEGSFLAPLPDGPLGNVLKIINRSGDVVSTIGDPSLRSVVGVNWSPADPVMVVDTEIPGSDDRYTMSIAAEGNETLAPTTLSVDEPDFAPDGSYVVAVGPSKGLKELVRIELDNLDRTNLVVDEEMCGPKVSPDATRIVYGGGPNCSRLMLISASGGRAFDITPLDAPDTTSFGVAELGWTTDGRFVSYPNCQSIAGTLNCGGASKFIEPDTGRVLDGPVALTVAPIDRPLIQDVFLDFVMRGPLDVSHSFLISAETQGQLTDTENGGFLEAILVDGLAEMGFKMTAGDNGFVTGTMEIDDPEAGINRTFTILARANLLGVRIVRLSGIWMSTSDLPMATGEFVMAIRRR
ncbi:MAG: TolB family protein [Microthrixaceae bacterium]